MCLYSMCWDLSGLGLSHPFGFGKWHSSMTAAGWMQGGVLTKSGRQDEQLKPLDQAEHSRSYSVEYSSNGKYWMTPVGGRILF